MTTQDTTTHACPECQPGPDELRDRIAAEIASYWEGRPRKDIASIAGQLAGLAMFVVGPALTAQRQVVMTLAAERIRLQRELAAAAHSVETWRSLSGSWQRTAERHRADSQRYEDVATELRLQVDALVRQVDRLRAEHEAQDAPEPTGRVIHVSWHPNAVQAAVDHALAIIKADATSPDDVYHLPGGPLSWQDLACLADAGRAALGSEDTRPPGEWHLGDPEPSGWPMHVIGSRSSLIWTREQPAPGGYWLNESPDGISGETWEGLLEAESAVTRHD